MRYYSLKEIKARKQEYIKRLEDLSYVLALQATYRDAMKKASSPEEKYIILKWALKKLDRFCSHANLSNRSSKHGK